MPTRILTVDDNRTVRLVVRRAFESFDCEVTEAANGEEGLAAVAGERPDLILLDVAMPIMDGLEMLRRLKKAAELSTIPVIMLTAERGEEVASEMKLLGANDCLFKPFKESQLLEKTQRFLALESQVTLSEE